jgi:hypothetical protein
MVARLFIVRILYNVVYSQLNSSVIQKVRRFSRKNEPFFDFELLKSGLQSPKCIWALGFGCFDRANIIRKHPVNDDKIIGLVKDASRATIGIL